jgi:uncharacterized protein YeaO (DUF488 family)
VTISVKRIYELASRSDGMRILVDRMWPRGLKKDEAKIELWLKDVAPTNSLRGWFGHRLERWDIFRERYLAELSANPAVAELKELLKRKRITLLYSAHDKDHNQAVVLADYLKKASCRRKRPTGSRRPSSR